MIEMDGNTLLTYKSGDRAVKVNERVTKIAIFAFRGENIEKIIIPDSVTHIGDGAFSGCRNLRKIRLPKRVEYFGHGVFSHCDKLERVELPEGVKEIRYVDFSRNFKGSVYIPDTVAMIDDFTFWENHNIKIYCKENSYAHKYAVKKGFEYILI